MGSRAPDPPSHRDLPAPTLRTGTARHPLCTHTARHLLCAHTALHLLCAQAQPGTYSAHGFSLAPTLLMGSAWHLLCSWVQCSTSSAHRHSAMVCWGLLHAGSQALDEQATEPSDSVSHLENGHNDRSSWQRGHEESLKQAGTGSPWV